MKCKFELKREYLKNHAFSNYFKFYKTTLKTPKTNFLQLDKLYTFAFRLHPKMYFDFELGFSGVKLITGNQGFRKFKSIHDFELDSNNTIQHIQHKTRFTPSIATKIIKLLLRKNLTCLKDSQSFLIIIINIISVIYKTLYKQHLHAIN